MPQAAGNQHHHNGSRHAPLHQLVAESFMAADNRAPARQQLSDLFDTGVNRSLVFDPGQQFIQAAPRHVLFISIHDFEPRN